MNRLRGVLQALFNAVILALGAFVIQLLIWPILSPYAWVLFFPTVFLAAAVSGFVSGVAATLTSSLLLWWRFVPPEGALVKGNPKYLLSAGIIVALGIALSALQGRLRRASQARATALAESESSNVQLKQLLNQRAIFTALIENSSDFIGIADPQGVPLYINPAGRRMVGLAPDFPVSGTHILEYYPTEQRVFVSDVIMKTVLEQGRWEGETYFRHWRTEHAIAVSDTHFVIRSPDGGRTLGMGTITRDISEIKRIRDELEASNQRLERANRAQQFLSEAGTILASKLDYEEILTTLVRLAVHEFADVSSVDIFEDRGIFRLRMACRDPSLEWACEILRDLPPDRRRPHPVWSTFQTQRPIVMESISPEMAASFAQGSPERLRAVRALDPRSAITVPLLTHGKVFGIFTVVSLSPSQHYTTDDVHLIEALALRAAVAIENARLYEAAQRALRARDEMLGIVAHDLRNPLNSIVIQANLLKQLPTAPQREASESAAAIHRSAIRMNRLIEDLLDVARAEAGGLSITRAPVSADQLVRGAVQAHGSLAAAASLELKTDIDRDLPEVVADRDRLLQVFDNLIGNALKFTPAGGHITVGASAAGENIRFWVSDTGTGIAAEDVPHVFDRFWQARQGERRGAGLGLAIAKGIVEAHGGRIWADSRPNQGSKFSFTIPLGVQTVAGH